MNVRVIGRAHGKCWAFPNTVLFLSSAEHPLYSALRCLLSFCCRSIRQRPFPLPSLYSFKSGLYTVGDQDLLTYWLSAEHKPSSSKCGAWNAQEHASLRSETVKPSAWVMGHLTEALWDVPLPGAQHLASSCGPCSTAQTRGLSDLQREARSRPGKAWDRWLQGETWKWVGRVSFSPAGCS